MTDIDDPLHSPPTRILIRPRGIVDVGCEFDSAGRFVAVLLGREAELHQMGEFLVRVGSVFVQGSEADMVWVIHIHFCAAGSVEVM